MVLAATGYSGMSSTFYDVVIVGAGIAGALISKRLTAKGMKVLLLEAGTTTALNGEGYQQHLDTFYQANGKGAEAPWPPTKAAPQPDTADLRTGTGYFVQRGPDLYGSSYTRLAGGSTLHFLGVSLRMLPEDFRMKSLHGISRDWPLRYEDLEPYYSQAEHEIGVSANADEQSYLGISFAEGYDYPMERVPLSYSDEFLGGSVNGLNVKLEEESFKVRIRSYPAARNSLPRGTYKPIGMSGNAFQGAPVRPILDNVARETPPAYPSVPCRPNTMPERHFRNVFPNTSRCRPSLSLRESFSITPPAPCRVSSTSVMKAPGKPATKRMWRMADTMFWPPMPWKMRS